MNPFCRPVYLLIAATLVGTTCFPLPSRGQTTDAGDVLRRDPALDRLVPAGAKVEIK